MEIANAVRKATPDDLPQLSAALSKAFFDDPLMAWAIPDVDRRQRLLPEFLRPVHQGVAAGPPAAALDPGPGGAVLRSASISPAVLIDAQPVGARIATVVIADSTPPHGRHAHCGPWPIRPASCPTRHFLAAARAA